MSELPESWIEITLGDVVNYGKTEKAEPNEIPADAWVLELEDIEKDTSKLLQRLTFAERKSKSTKNRFDAGDVLYGKLRPYLNKVIVADQNGFATTEIIPLKQNDAIHGRYLFYWLKHPRFLDYVETVSHGINMPRLGTEAGLQAPLILAPLNEQKRIAAKLDALLERVDACRARLERVPLLLKRFRQAVLAAATSGQLTEDWQEGESEWNEATIDEISELISGFAFKSEWFKSNGNHQVVKIANVKDGYLDLKAAPAFITYDLAKEYERFQAWPQDILISMTGTKYKQDYGFVGLAQPGMNIWVNQRVSIIRAKEGQINPEFLFLFLRSQEFRQQFFKGETGQVNQGNVGSNHIKSCQVRFPSMLKQAEIVRRVETLFAYADRLEARYQQARAEVERLTPALLAKAFRGELVPQDPNDEPASVLLEQLQAERAMTTAKPKQRAASLNGKR